MHHDVAGNFKGAIAEEENTRENSKSGAADVQRPVHIERGIPDIDSVDVTNDEEKQNERKQAPPDLAQGAFLQAGNINRRACATACHGPASLRSQTAHFGNLVTSVQIMSDGAVGERRKFHIVDK
jgi:hypothetical protein